MVTEQNKIIEALKTAIVIEKDGKECDVKAVRTSGSVCHNGVN